MGSLNKSMTTDNIQQAKNPLNSSKNAMLNKNISTNNIQQAKSYFNYSKNAMLIKSMTRQIANGLTTTSSNKDISAVKNIDCIDLSLKDEDNQKVGGAASNENQKA